MGKDYENYPDDIKEHSEEEIELQSLLIHELKGGNNSPRTSTRRNTERHNPPAVPTAAKEKKKRKTHWGCIVTVILILLLITGGAVGYYYYTQHEKAKKEKLMYDVLTEDNYNRRDYEDFIREFPDSKYRGDVEQKLEKLQEMYDDWDRVKNSQNVSALKSFCEKYPLPNSELYTLALEEIDKLDWKFAKTRNTIEAYDHYLNIHPEGGWALEAATEKAQLIQAEEERIRLEEEERLKAAAEEQRRIDSINNANSFNEKGKKLLDLFFN